MPRSRSRQGAKPRTFAALAVLLVSPPAAIAGGWSAIAARVAARAPITHTAQGDLSGAIEADGVRVFRGIPYATAARWKPPVAATAWRGVRDATRAGPACFQPLSPPTGLYSENPPAMSEDCLSLNVWAPRASAGAKPLPVMVWIHGGALLHGYNGSPTYDGTRLAERGVVVVSINYRLGVFGFLAHPELSRESPRGVSGNYGLLDQIEALKWVKRNAAAFGGDPGNVTIFGESAGGLSVTTLLASPLARGLFDKAIAESAYLVSFPELKATAHGTPAAEAIGTRFATTLGAPDLAALRAMPPARLAAGKFLPLPTVDGWLLPRQLVDAYDRGEQARVPVIAGFNAGEIRSLRMLLPPKAADAATYEAQIRARYRDLAGRFLGYYPSSDIDGSMLAALRDGMYGWTADRVVKSQTGVGQPAFLYYFDHGYPAADERQLHAFHASEVPYVFGTLTANDLPRNWPVPGDTPRERALSDAMIDYWTSFATTGAPRAKGAAAWPAYGAAHRFLHFAKQPVAATGLFSGPFALQEEVVARRRRAGTQPWVQNVGLASPPVPPADAGTGK